MHSFRHTVASHALLAGESVNEVTFLLEAPRRYGDHNRLRPGGGRCAPAVDAPVADDGGISAALKVALDE